MIRELLSRLRVGKKIFATIVLTGLATQVWALGLGEIQLDSALNEKLEASIELYDATGLQPTEIIVSMASADDFARVGVERFFFLTDIRFEVAYDRNGVGEIKVSSSQPITEPYLNFLVEVLWPNGRLLKEYTLLLDPPTFGQAAAPQVSAPSRAAETASRGRIDRESTATSGTQVQMAPTAGPAVASPLDQGVVDGQYRMTDRSDTLWEIALQTRPSSQVTVQQNMLAIKRLNPEAFLRDNINLLKAGYNLRLPSEREALGVEAANANAIVAQQNQDWRALSRGESVAESSTSGASSSQVAGAEDADLRGQVDATADAGREEAPAEVSEGELRIVAGQGDSVSGTATGAADDEQLSSVMEEQDRLTREVDELTYQLDREKELAANQLAVKERQLDVKDQQIAEMQAEMERVREELKNAQSAQEGTQSQNQSAAQKSAQPWWQSPYVLGGGAGALILLLAYGLIAARRRRAEAEEYYPEEAEADEYSAFIEKPEEAYVEETPDAELESDQYETPVITDDADSEAQAQGSETSDVIGEADIYIAYGRYPQAISLLLGVLTEDPGRNDVRFKLLELYAETRDRAGFDEHMAELLERCDDEEALLSARELGQQFGDEDQPRVPADDRDEAQLEAGHNETGVATADLENLLDDLAQDDTLDVTTAEAATAELEALDTGDFETLTDATASPIAGADIAEEIAESAEGITESAEEIAESAEIIEASADLDESLDFELELDENSLAEDSEAAAEKVSAGAGDQLGGDLGMDFKLEDEAANGVADELEATPGDEDLGPGLDAELAELDDVELDLDLGAESAAEEDEFDFGDEADVATTKLDLARAYIDMGDEDGARDILNEVLAEGNPEQQQQAQTMLGDL